MASRGGRIRGDDFHRPRTWLLLGLGGLVAIGWGLKPSNVTINNYSEPENAIVIPWARNLPPINIYVKPGTDPAVIEAEAARMRDQIERPRLFRNNPLITMFRVPALYFSDCKDDPFFGTDQQRTELEQLRHNRGLLDAQVRTRALQGRTTP